MYIKIQKNKIQMEDCYSYKKNITLSGEIVSYYLRDRNFNGMYFRSVVEHV